MKKIKSTPRATPRRCAVSTGSGWVSVRDALPEGGQLVLATYVGVYGYRLVKYWTDGRPHFGFPDSQPATHWHPLPSLPNSKR